MKKLLVVAALLAPLAANAVSLEVGIGSTNYGAQGDGTWYQQGMPHVLNLKSYGFSAGFTGELYSHGPWGVDWHVNYVNLGHLSSSCDCTPMDENYDTKTHHLVPNPTNVPNATFVGNGNAQGVSFTLEPWVKLQGWRFGMEAGLFPYRPAWDMDVYNWQVNLNVAPQTLHVGTPHAWQLGQVVGVSVGRGNWKVALKHYWLPTKFDNDHSPAIWKGATVVEMKYRF